ncbi:DUF2512 family protein [Sediminibacillus dalangtanensis]|uniref:DUF2512 family protein n=1 Tax=Sediminibacillus dalangtanensis TaxID=2729421 RepID=A0ABX7VS04_9BACI|nr:DUF2512 family protein [Sediminibacillus dalangtanensis]QTM98575.1 DUF2512 family protein [Sediminibacillus dalangtanensis]
MEHGKALGMKALMVLPIMWIIMTLIFDVSFWSTTILGIILIVAAYALGDMMIFPRTSNMMATLSDFGLALIVLWIGLAVIGAESTFLPALITAVVIAAGEWFYHKWLVKNNMATIRESRKLSESH